MNPARAWLAWIALVPFFLAILVPALDGQPLRYRETATLGYACGIGWYLGNCYWIYQTMYLYGGLPKPVAFCILVLFALYLGIYHAVFAVLLVVVQRAFRGTVSALLLAPTVWVAVELARSRVTGFPWDLLGNSQVDNLWVTRIAPLAGVMAISFLVGFANAGVASLFLGKGKVRLWFGGAGVAVAVVSIAGGAYGKTHGATLSEPTQSAVLMQENLLVGAEGRTEAGLSTGDELRAFRWATLHPQTVVGPDGSTLSLAAPSNPTIVVWPEAPSHFRSDDPAFREAIGELVKASGAPAIIGSLGVDFTEQARRGYSEYDSASLFEASGSYAGRYDKIHLVPWGEYIPFKRFFFFAGKLTEGVGDMDPGSSRSVFEAGGHRYGVFICYESIFGDEVREFVRNGAEVLVNISDDGWYGDSGAPWQHLNMARMRAIENHRWLLRSTNTGVTTSIDPSGRLRGEAPRHVRGAFSFPFAWIDGTTFYTRHGDWFAWLCALVSMSAVGGGLSASLRSGTKPHRAS